MRSQLRDLLSPERRRARRVEATLPPERALQLCVEDRCLGIARVRDVSPFGLCVLLHRAIADDAQVRLIYADETVRLEVRGTVVWRKLEKEATGRKSLHRACRVGIFLHPRDMQANLDFYEAIVRSA